MENSASTPRRGRRGPVPRIGATLALLGLAGACMERGDRWYLDESEPACTQGERRCVGKRLEQCVNTGRGTVFATEADCGASELICSPTLLACSTCQPATQRCEGQVVARCNERGEAFEPLEQCKVSENEACREGACANLCALAAERRSNVGCEYWAVDLDNARVSEALNAAAQQYAVVLSNPQPDVQATITISQDDAQPGKPGRVTEVARSTIPPFSLQVFKLGPREVDGSAPGTFDTGTGTALSRGAYRITSSVPIVAYQFNPLANVNVFSNDASLLKPVEAVAPTGNTFTDAYVVLGWPQTIAVSDDPRTNFNSRDPTNLRAFLTLVGTRDGTRVRVTSSTHVIGGGTIAETPAGGTIETELDAFDVLNLETSTFNADFSGSIIAADGPVVVFSGSEASDAPYFMTLSERRCCADHLEEQLDPIRTAGREFIATVSPNRTQAVVAAGAKLEVVPQPEFFRVIAATDAGARVSTTLEGDMARFELTGKGAFADLSSTEHFALSSDAPLMLVSVSASQEAANIPRGLPGGDPSLLVMPPIEQFRSTYVFLTPDKYSFDFVRIVAPLDADIVLDAEDVRMIDGCSAVPISIPKDLSRAPKSVGALAEQWLVYTCQLSFPEIDPDLAAPANLSPGLQFDGVHRLTASRTVGVLVDGFDSFVSYAYAGGTELEFIVPE
jgi:hypothetical protein